jgi:hypothetical protein
MAKLRIIQLLSMARTTRVTSDQRVDISVNSFAVLSRFIPAEDKWTPGFIKGLTHITGNIFC